MKKITIEIKVTNQYGQESMERYYIEPKKALNNEAWDEIVKGLIEESISIKEEQYE